MLKSGWQRTEGGYRIRNGVEERRVYGRGRHCGQGIVGVCRGEFVVKFSGASYENEGPRQLRGRERRVESLRGVPKTSAGIILYLVEGMEREETTLAPIGDNTERPKTEAKYKYRLYIFLTQRQHGVNF